ncbi:hypothetical protein C2845_PM06G14890 [Panicum miliaceum]|uniref:Saccharopine dehydrogenase NADP binding domain-containing protein n=1 Tax=Panicum miliaceum TaxID=4540 RepID=A0A3L6RDP7_PANMI|nr:hypothetical protein C2845_PM06G14890 [Panicum miliaceum]
MVRACAPPAAVGAASAAPSARDAAQTKRSSSRTARVLVLGGTGRVGGSTAAALSKLRPDLSILVGGRNRHPTLTPHPLPAPAESVDLVVHTAGPFQRAEECTVLQAAISTKTAYIDVCDDTDYSWRAKGFHEQAKAAGVPAITTAGIYPGVSNGTGGAGPTILTTSFLLLGEDELLRDKSKVQKLVESIDPLVRAVDGIAGERVSMRIDLECSNGRNTVGLFTHKKLSVSVGYPTAAFALSVLEGNTQPGVWFPEEPEGIPIEAREPLLECASQGTSNLVMNKPSWMVETDPKEVGLGIYV